MKNRKEKSMKILALGDVVGERTLPYLRENLGAARRNLSADLVIANGENVCDIHGLSPACASALFDSGVDLITGGNHIFDRRDVTSLLEDDRRILRPANYPPECPGMGSGVVTSADGYRVLAVNVSGRVFMDALDDPFRAVERELASQRGRYDFAVLDIHAEATSEKLALALFFDGRFSAVFGTHTHVQTADARVLPGGSGYLSDLGMTGPAEGILGVESADVIGRLTTKMPHRFHVAEGRIEAQGALFDIDPVTGRCREVRPVRF